MRRSSVDYGAPTSSRQIPIDDGAAEQAHDKQGESHAGFVEQQFSGAEQDAINQSASGDPIEQVRQTVTRRFDIGP